MEADILLAGGGLANGLIALALARLRPELKVVIVERGERIGGNHLWSFFDTDIAPEVHWLVEPLIAHHWRGYDVSFPGFSRRLTTPYNSATSDRLDATVRAMLPAEHLLLGKEIAEVSAGAILLADGRRLTARAVIDGRGGGDAPALELAWQKFLGQELQLVAPHGLDRPVVMDATVAQHDGYRFVYLLPLAADRIFIEDTYYSDGPALDEIEIAARIAHYAAQHNWQIDHVIRAETGVLPVALGGDIDLFWKAAPVGRAGLNAALFHPTTGYSLPDAVRLAMAVAGCVDIAAMPQLTMTWSKQTWRERGFYRLLDRLLFQAAAPKERYRVLARFYRLEQGLIERFYAGASTAFDKFRILAGKPPVPIRPAIRAMFGDKAVREDRR